MYFATMKILIVIAAVCLVVQTIPNLELLKQWKSFKLKYGKQYSSETEENFRMKIFMDKLHMIETHNKKYELGLVSYNLAMNRFGDLLSHEVINNYTGINKSIRLRPREKRATFIEPKNVEIPDSIDWREKGAVTPVKDQGHCGSCWAFSTTGSVEGQHFLKTGNLVNLSEQNLVDCSISYYNFGCYGGLQDNAFRYILDHGIDTEESYPYEAGNARCRFNPKTVGATITGFVDIEAGSELQLQQAVGTVGPVSVVIDASGKFFHYHSGVYDEPNCDEQALCHAVLAVGYNTTDDGKDYWIVKNSWGPNWGRDGYILMSRNKNDQCGIAYHASYPLV